MVVLDVTVVDLANILRALELAFARDNPLFDHTYQETHAKVVCAMEQLGVALTVEVKEET